MTLISATGKVYYTQAERTFTLTKCCRHRCCLRRSPTVALVLALLGCEEFCTFFE
jgi:hypothetical protein